MCGENDLCDCDAPCEGCTAFRVVIANLIKERDECRMEIVNLRGHLTEAHRVIEEVRDALPGDRS